MKHCPPRKLEAALGGARYFIGGQSCRCPLPVWYPSSNLPEGKMFSIHHAIGTNSQHRDPLLISGIVRTIPKSVSPTSAKAQTCEDFLKMAAAGWICSLCSTQNPKPLALGQASLQHNYDHPVGREKAPSSTELSHGFWTSGF